jgi:diadenylate cyclase
MRRGLERIIQQGKGALIVMGHNSRVGAASSGGFRLANAAFSPARLAELSKMDGGVILDDTWGSILEANVHFVPDGSLHTDETGARHRTAERLAIQTGKPVVAVSEGRKVATLFYRDEKIELAQPTEVAAHVNQELQSLDRLRSRLDEALTRLTRLEVIGLSSYRGAVTVIQRAALVEKLGRLVESRTLTLGDEDRIVTLQLNDLISGVDRTMRLVLQDYLKPLRANSVQKAVDVIEAMAGSEIDDPARVARALGFPDLDDPAQARGHRLLSYVGRLPDSVREDIVKHFGTVSKLLRTTKSQLTAVEGVGDTRADQLRTFFDRVETQALEWEVVLD